MRPNSGSGWITRMVCMVCLVWMGCLVRVAIGAESVGTTFEVVEEDMVEVLQREARAAWGTAPSDLAAAVRAYADRPPPVLGVTRTVHARSWTEDPTIVLRQPIRGADGTVLIPAGVRYHPLKSLKTPLQKALLFYNGDDPEQLRWVESSSVKGSDLRIMVQGSPSRTHPVHPVYFDQGGQLSRRFHIQHVPARVSQVGEVFRVEECVP